MTCTQKKTHMQFTVHHDRFGQIQFSICDQRTLTIEAHDRSIRLPIPEWGLQASDITEIEYAFEEIGRHWLVTQLGRPEFEGAAGRFVAVMVALLHGLHPVEDPPPDDFCVVCQNTEEGGWVTITGCSRHRFHKQCVEGQFCGTTCMLCGTPLWE